jgi:DNA invertase Pin-like site-specific DNA recombinase
VVRTSNGSTMIYGYARVSTAAQDETGQVRQLKAAGCEKVFRDKITGTTADRPQLRALMKKLAPGDVVITPAVDRLSRDTTDLLVIAREMQRAGPALALPLLRHVILNDQKSATYKLGLLRALCRAGRRERLIEGP